MPPLTCSVTLKEAPTELLRAVPWVVTAGIAAIVMVTVAVCEGSAIDATVMVADCEELVAAGAVNVAEVVVSFDRAPAPVMLHDTPAAFLSLATVAISVVVSAPSTVLAVAVTVTLGEGELPPQPVNSNSDERTQDARIPTQSGAHFLCSIFLPPKFYEAG